MKAWNDLERDVSLYWTGDAVNPDSLWYMDHGCKIERFKDGTIEIKNAMLAGDMYKDISREQLDEFEKAGWLAGCYKVCIDTYGDRILRVNKLLSTYPDNPELINRLDALRKKLSRYVELHNKMC